MSILFSTARHGVEGVAARPPIEIELLSRAGMAWHALLDHWHDDPDDLHPTNEQLLDRLGNRVHKNTLLRGLAELVKYGKIRIGTDRTHPVGRRIEPATLLEQGRPTLSIHTVDGGLSSETPYVLRVELDSLHVDVRGLSSETPPSIDPIEPLNKLIARLQTHPDSIEPLVDRLCREYGDKYRNFYRARCREVSKGKLAISVMIEAAEYAEGGEIVNPGASFIRRVKDRIKGVLKPYKLEAAAPSRAKPEPKPEPKVEAVKPQPVERATEIQTQARTEAQDAVLKSRWQQLTDQKRQEIEDAIKAENPGLMRWKNMLLPLCLNRLEQTLAIEGEWKIETAEDRNLRMLADLAHAADPLMKAIARSELRQAGRGDLFGEAP